MPAALKRSLPYVLAYLLWLVSSAASVIALLQFQSAFNVLGALLGWNRYVLRLGNQVALLVGGLAAFVYAMLLLGYYQSGAQRGTLGPRFLKTVAVPVVVTLAALLVVEVGIRN